MKKSNYSTLIIANKYSNDTKIYTIKDKHIKNILLYKKIILCSCLIIFVLLSVFFIYMGYETYEKEKLYSKVADLENKLDNKQINEMINNLNRAEESLLKIEKYLNDRKVKITTSSKSNEKNTNAGVGGEYYPIENINSDFIEFKKQRVSELLMKIQSIPIGLPHIGRVTSTFGVRGNPFSKKGGEFHPGLDLAGTIGDPIKATANGIVSYAGVKGGYGNCVMIKHAYGYETLYGHMSEINVRIGQKIKASEIIGKLGNTGRSTGPHVHYEVIYNKEKENPTKYLYIP